MIPQHPSIDVDNRHSPELGYFSTLIKLFDFVRWPYTYQPYKKKYFEFRNELVKYRIIAILVGTLPFGSVILLNYTINGINGT